VLCCTQAAAGELKVFSLGIAGPILHDLAPEFERSTGNRMVIVFGPSGATLKRMRGEWNRADTLDPEHRMPREEITA
jgi:ABC-type molybdate transport system substrate-binding protein